MRSHAEFIVETEEIDKQIDRLHGEQHCMVLTERWIVCTSNPSCVQVQDKKGHMQLAFCSHGCLHDGGKNVKKTQNKTVKKTSGSLKILMCAKPLLCLSKLTDTQVNRQTDRQQLTARQTKRQIGSHSELAHVKLCAYMLQNSLEEILEF